MTDQEKPGTTRRTFMVGGAAAALGAAAIRRPGTGKMTDDQARLVDDAGAVSASGASLSDVDHVVILMQENRSFDHYFGTMSSVRGLRTRGREAWPGEAQETTTPVVGLSPQVRWICSGVPAPPARARRVRMAALAGPAVAASRPVPPAPASI